MHRLLVTVLKAEPAGRRRDPSGLLRGSFRLRVKVKGAAVGALKAPARVVGLEGSLRRDFLLPWAPRRGDLLVLDPSESRRFLVPRGARARRLSPTATARVSVADVDGDGWQEDVFSNPFVSGAVQPHRGARLLSLAGRSGADRFAQPVVHIMAGQYVLLGGAEEFLLETGMPGEIWNAAFSREASAAGATYARKLKTPEGVALTKEVRVEDGLPGVLEVVRLSYAGKPSEEGDEDDGGEPRKPDRTDVSLGIRMSTRVLGPVGSTNVIEIPSRGELVKVRFHRPAYGRRWRWRDWKDEFFGIGPAFLVSRNEREGNALAVLFGFGRAAVVNVRSDFEGPEVMLRSSRVALVKGRSAEFGAAFLPADALAASGTSLLLATLGRPSGGTVPLALTLRSSERVARPLAALDLRRGGRRAIALRRREVPAAGVVYAAVVPARASWFPLACSVKLGAERLECVVEG